jgi:hypothetical protein
MPQKTVYVVEDDHLQSDWIIRTLGKALGPEVDIRLIKTHSDFLSRFGEIATAQPACIILDVRLQWTDQDAYQLPADPDSYERAGMECRQILADSPATSKIPILLYSVQDRKGIPGYSPDMAFLRKDSHDSKLIEWVRRAVTTRCPAEALSNKRA